MSKRELAEILYEMSMDMDWMDYEETKERDVDYLESVVDRCEETFKCALSVFMKGAKA